MKMKTQKIVIAAMMSALCCVATMIVKIPSPFKGYLNLGDCIVLLSGWLLSPYYAFLSAGIGSSLADAFSGYVLYTPATFVIKGAMAIVAHFLFKALRNKTGSLLSRIFSGIVAEVIMVAGYFVFEGFLYGFVPSAVNIPANAVQGVAGIIVGALLVKMFENTRIFR